ncbi:unnamed protein product, partial [Brassica rapa subsp. narinosa]
NDSLAPSQEGSNPTTDDVSLCPEGVSSVASRVLRQKNDANPPRTTTVSVLTASPPTSVSVLTEITSQG